MIAHIHYRLEGDDAILTRALDDVVLLYHRPSGQTHIVVSPVPQLIDVLRDGRSGSARDLLERMSRDYDLGPATEALEHIEAHLVELALLGLVRAA